MSPQSGKLLGKYGESPALFVNQIQVMEDSVRDRNRPNKDPSHGSPFKSPLTGSISSLYGKRRQIFEDMHEVTVTPLNILGSCLGKLTPTHGEGLSSIQKSISQLDKTKSSPYGSARVGIEKSKLKSADYLSRVSPLKAIEVSNSIDMNLDPVNASISSLDGTSLNVETLRREHETTTADSNGVETINTSKRVCASENEEARDCASFKQSLHNTPVGTVIENKYSESIRIASLSAEKAIRTLSVAENPEQDLISLDTESPNFKQTEDIINDKFVVSPVKRLGQKLSDSPDCQVSYGVLVRENQSNVISGPGDQEALDDVSTSGSHLILLTDEIIRSKDRLPLGHSQMEKVANRAAEPFALCNDSEDMVNLKTPSRPISIPSLQSGSPANNLLTGTEPSLSRKERIKNSSTGSVSSYFHKRSSIGQSIQGVNSFYLYLLSLFSKIIFPDLCLSWCSLIYCLAQKSFS